MCQVNNLTNIIEAITFASGEAVPVKFIVEKLGVSIKEVNKSVDELKEKFPYFYEMKHANPRIEFNISNPKWEDKAFNIYSDSQFCRADISFTNIPSDTVMGYSQEQYFTLENAYCSILYKVSRQGKKYKAIVSNLYCEPSYGYR